MLRTPSNQQNMATANDSKQPLLSPEEGYTEEGYTKPSITQGAYPPAATPPVFGGSSAASHQMYYDVESGETRLFPGIQSGEQMVRMGFIKKVYGIVFAQLFLTALLSGLLMSSSAARAFAQKNAFLQILSLIAPLVLLWPLHTYRNRHPTNLYLLGAFTLTLGWGVALATTAYSSGIVLEALILTAAVTGGLTAYTFWAARRGQEFDWMGPFLFSSLLCLVVWSFLALVFPMAPMANQVMALIGAVIFSGYIVYDTFLLIKRFSVDEYIWAAVNLYLDIINLFLKILRLLGDRRD